MTHTDIVTAALALHNTRRTFATLDRHRNAGRFDRLAALRLLARNVRDTGIAASTMQRRAATRLLLAVWENGQ